MAFQRGKSFITILLAVVVLGGWFAGQNEQMSKAPAALAQVGPAPVAIANVEQPAAVSAAEAPDARVSDVTSSNFEDGYRAGYRDAQRDCVSGSRSVARTRYAPRSRARVSRVAGARYYAEPRRGHSTRDMILRIAAPAAIGAGIGAIAGGKRGAGAGALIGGGGGALYHLLKHRRD